MKTTIEINGYEIVIDENREAIIVTATKEGETIEEFTLEMGEESTETQEEKDFPQELPQGEDEIETQEKEEDEEYLEDEPMIESYAAFLERKKSNITSEAFDNIYHDPEAVEYCLKAGIDPNSGRKSFIRKCIKGNWKSKEDIGEPYYKSIDLLVKYGATYLTKENFRTAVFYGRIKIIDDMIQKGYIEEVANKSEFGKISAIKEDYLGSFVKHINDNESNKVIKHLDKLIEKYEN